jgi:uncharacterized protein
MSLATVAAIKRFVKPLPKHDARLTIAWHAGEPLTAGRQFYEDAFAILDNTSFRHNFQTNATLIDDEWCAMFARHDVSIGVSIDGPKHVHDGRRITRSGKGTFDRAMRGIEALKRNGIPFTTIAVITPDLLRDMDGTVAFFTSLGSKQIGFNVEEAEGVHSDSTLYAEPFEKLIVKFFERLTMAQAKDASLRVRELDAMRNSLRAPVNSTICRSTNIAGSILSFDVDGNVSTFSPELLGTKAEGYGGFIWGNAVTDNWSSVISNTSFQDVHSAIRRGIELCERNCGYYGICGGGDPSNKLAEYGTFEAAETKCCRLHVQTVADVVLRELERSRAGTEN